MSHVVIIIQRAAAPTTDQEYDLQPSYEYSIPIPHDASPAQVGEMVRRAYRRLEGAED